jgi:outer membrane protein assembly factor BamB
MARPRLRIHPPAADGRDPRHASYSESPLNVGSAPDAGNGRVYYVRNLGYLMALDASNGSVAWTYQDGSILDMPIVSLDASLIAVSGQPTYGTPGFFKGISPAGRLL